MSEGNRGVANKKPHKMRKVIFYLLKIWLNVDDCQGLSKINQTMRKQSYKKYISQGSLYTKKNRNWKVPNLLKQCEFL